MPIEPGTSLGPYTITAKMGQGGMGEVYQARDTTLDREVALRVLPDLEESDGRVKTAFRMVTFQRARDDTRALHSRPWNVRGDVSEE